LLAAAAGIFCLGQPLLAAEQPADAWSNIRAYSQDKKAEAVAYGKQLMKDTDARIAELEAKTAALSGEAKHKYDRELTDLKATRAKTAAKLEQMEKSGGAAWNEAKEGFADAYRDLQRAYRKAAEKF
jgi:DNA repair ATPase RecN